jgi:hypothetical protein
VRVQGLRCVLWAQVTVWGSRCALGDAGVHRGAITGNSDGPDAHLRELKSVLGYRCAYLSGSGGAQVANGTQVLPERAKVHVQPRCAHGNHRCVVTAGVFWGNCELIGVMIPC